MAYNTVELMENHELIPIMQAAQRKDMAFRNRLDPDRRECFDDYVQWFDELRAQNGGTLKGLDIDLPYF